MTYSELLEIVLDARYCEGIEGSFFTCENCKVAKRREAWPGLTCDGVAATHTEKLRAIMKKLDEMNLEVPV